MPGGVELSPSIDRSWLDQALNDDPVSHAYAVWDLANSPDRVRFVSARSPGGTEGYLLWWTGHPSVPIVHWVGGESVARELAEALPPRPLVVVAPPRVRGTIVAARGPAREFGLLLLVREAGTSPRDGGGATEGPGVRRLTGADRPAVTAWAATQHGSEVGEYRTFDPEVEVAWGAFEGSSPVGVARAAVRLPAIWVLAGVYVAPGARRQGWGRRLVAAVAAASDAAGARLLTFVREDSKAARGLYESVGFHRTGRRLWIDAGAGLEP
jgi:ribosomal protein S18 acetylase RimI-like enzyme